METADSLPKEPPAVTADDLVGQFLSFQKSNVETILHQGLAVYRADTELVPDHKLQFYSRVKLVQTSSKARKFKTIGKNHLRLLPYLDVIRPDWTTIHTLCSYSTDEFQKVVDARVLSFTVTAKELNDIAKGHTGKRSVRDRIVIDLSSAADVRTFIQKLEELARSHSIDLSRNSVVNRLRETGVKELAHA